MSPENLNKAVTTDIYRKNYTECPHYYMICIMYHLIMVLEQMYSWS